MRGKSKKTAGAMEGIASGERKTYAFSFRFIKSQRADNIRLRRGEVGSGVEALVHHR